MGTRRCLTFSLRSLFVLLLVVAAYFGGWRSALRIAEREKEAAVRKAVAELQTARKAKVNGPEGEYLSFGALLPPILADDFELRAADSFRQENEVVLTGAREEQQ